MSAICTGENPMNILAKESFGARSSIRSLKGGVTRTGTAPDHTPMAQPPSMHTILQGGEPGNPLPCH
jgi:hypothetical protein